MSDDHASAQLIEGYADGVRLPDDQVWALEAHLESCAVCRARLAEATPEPVPSLVAGVWSALTPELAGQAPARRRLASRLVPWATPVMLPWLVMVVLVAAVAVLLDRMVDLDDQVSFLQLFAPVLPVLGVAAAWAPGLDPAHELSAASPRAGLSLVLRRTAAVLVVLVPPLAVAGWLIGTTIALWLLPCLAFTTGTLALGGLIGVRRAAFALLFAWAAVVLEPAVADQPVWVLHGGSTPVWAGLLVVTTATVVLRRNAFSTLKTED